MQWPSVAEISHGCMRDILPASTESKPLEKKTDRLFGEDLDPRSDTLTAVLPIRVLQLQVFPQSSTLRKVEVEPASENTKLQDQPCRHRVAQWQLGEDEVGEFIEVHHVLGDRRSICDEMHLSLMFSAYDWDQQFRLLGNYDESSLIVCVPQKILHGPLESIGQYCSKKDVEQ